MRISKFVLAALFLAGTTPTRVSVDLLLEQCHDAQTIDHNQEDPTDTRYHLELRETKLCCPPRDPRTLAAMERTTEWNTLKKKACIAYDARHPACNNADWLWCCEDDVISRTAKELTSGDMSKFQDCYRLNAQLKEDPYPVFKGYSPRRQHLPHRKIRPWNRIKVPVQPSNGRIQNEIAPPSNPSIPFSPLEIYRDRSRY